MVFSAEDRDTNELEQLLEAEAARQLNLRTDFILRTAAEWHEVVAGNPFPDQAAGDPSHLLVIFLKAAAEPEALEALCASIAGPEQLQAAGRHLYVTYPNGIARSKLTIEPKLRTRVTGRNWNTVLKLQAMATEYGVLSAEC